ncbi:amidohydrolase family protein [Amycolatopsis ultiminotia]|uniref:Amidohydrolase family protein n=1 Tax=Amycolatopsis ultiminotia TaxID=543629 RepID=A0ABP6XZQ3_9PSEU
MPTPARIDVHQHFVPPAWSRALTAGGDTVGGWAVPSWSPAEAVAMMDRQGIATGVLSVTAPGVHFDPGDDRAARELARQVNEDGAEIVRDRPDRFGLFASIPLPDVDGALTEATHALDVLGADGIVLVSNVHGRYLGDPDFTPLWAELDRRAAVVFVHPAQPPMAWLPGAPAPLVDFIFDTTRTAVDLVLAGVPRRFPNVRIILAHGGGFLPYAAYRFSGLTSISLDPDQDADELIRDFKRFYFDTALSASPSALPSLLAFAEPGHVLYGSDWPFAPEAAGEYYNGFLETYPCFESGGQEAIDRGNAEALFGRPAVR